MKRDRIVNGNHEVVEIGSMVVVVTVITVVTDDITLGARNSGDPYYCISSYEPNHNIQCIYYL